MSLGPNGGCNGGKPNTYPSNPGKITTDGATLTAYNECNMPSSVRISADGQTIFWYGESAKLDFSGAELRIKDDAGNIWEKITNMPS